MPETKKYRRTRGSLSGAVEQITNLFPHTVVAGSYRREKESVGDLDILVPQSAYMELIAAATTWFDYEPVRQGNLKSEGMCQYDNAPLLLNFWAVPKAEDWGGMLLFATGPYDLNIAMRARAKAQGWLLSQYGLFAASVRLDNGTEQSIFERLKMPYLLPVERNNWLSRIRPPAVTTVVQIHSHRTDEVYEVTMQNGEALDCTCMGFQYRSKCRHLKEAEEQSGKKD